MAHDLEELKEHHVQGALEGRLYLAVLVDHLFLVVREGHLCQEVEEDLYLGVL